PGRREAGPEDDPHGDQDERGEHREPSHDGDRQGIGCGDRDERPDAEDDDEHRDARPHLRVGPSHPSTLRSGRPRATCRKSWAGSVTTGTRGPVPRSLASRGHPAGTVPTGWVHAPDEQEDDMDAVDARNLTTRDRRKGGTTTAVDDVSLVAAEGAVLGVLGPNGAGKTTTVEMIAGVRRPDHGSVRVLGLDPFRDRAAVRQVLGV